MSSTLPVLALLFNAFVWGVSWWPLRTLQVAGLHPLWATALVYLAALACLTLLMPASALSFLRTPKLWLLAVAAGLTNICFNWAVTLGDVVRVVLLFYLMPAWSVLLAWWLLDERPTPLALLRLLLAFAGVVLVVLPPGAPLARLASGLSWIDLLAVTGNAYKATKGSGNPILNTAAKVMGSALEASNVDITEELVMLIAAQRNFQANAKAIEGASTLTQTVINMRT